MRFGTVIVEESLGQILAHGVHFKNVSLKKGEIINAAHIAALQTIGFTTITTAQLEPGDIVENHAAAVLAQALDVRANLSIGEAQTGRVNIHAVADGLFVADEAPIH